MSGIGRPAALADEGHTLLASGELDDAWAAVERFDRAARRDPACLSAWVGLATVFSRPPIVFSGAGRRLTAAEAFPKAKAYARRALELDEEQPDAWRVLGQVAHNWEYNWAAAEAAYRKALDYRPADSSITWLALLLASQGRFEEARRLLSPVAEQTNPLLALGFISVFERRFEDAVAYTRTVVERTGGFHFFLGLALAEAGWPAEAVNVFQTGPDIVIRNPGYIAGLARAYVLSGESEAGQRILNELSERRRNEQIVAYQIATVHEARGELSEAFDWLDIALEERGSWPTWLRLDPRLDRLRADERFQGLLHAVGNR